METTAVEVIRAEVTPIPEYAKAIVVIDRESMAQANEFFLEIKKLRKKIADTMDPIIAAAFSTHKTAVAKKKELEAPLVAAEGWLNGQIAVYHERQERIRREEEERLRKLALEEEMARRKKQEEEKLAQAAILEEQGAKDEAEQMVAEALQENEAPVIVNVQATTPKVSMAGMAMVTTWKFRITNESVIPRQYLQINDQAIGAVVRSLKDKTNTPGIQVYFESKPRATGR